MKPEQVAPVLEYLLRRGQPIGIDTETTGLNKLDDTVLFWSMATEDRRFFFPWELLDLFEPLFKRQDQRWYLANAKYDAHLLANMGAHLKGELWDIVVMDAMDDDTRSHRLKSQAFMHFGVRWNEFKDTFLNPTRVAETLGLDRKSFTAFKEKSVGDALLYVYDERPDIVENYATCDAYFTYLLAEHHIKSLSSTQSPTEVVDCIQNQFDYFTQIEVPLTRTLFNMERRGVKADLERAKEIEGPMLDGLAAAQANIDRLLGRGNFDPHKKDELRHILFDPSEFGLKPIKNTGVKAGVATSKSTPLASVDSKDLEILLERCGPTSLPGMFIAAYSKWAKIEKLYGTYVRDLSQSVSKKTGLVHANFNQAVARTSRLSSSDPNLQNLPARNDDYGLRSIFCALPGHLLISRDYPQIEFRVAAVLAGEEGMMADIRAGWDIHSANAARMYGVKHPGVTYEVIEEARAKKGRKEPLSALDYLCIRCRDGAKVVGLGTLYGQGAYRISMSLGCSKDEAQADIDAFFENNPKIADLITFMHDLAHAEGYSHTWLGRMRRLHQVANHFNAGVVAAEERQAFNMLIQGSSAEMIKLAMILIDTDKEFAQMGAGLLISVHDELIGQAPEGVVKDAARLMEKHMNNPYNLGGIQLTFGVPIPPDGGEGFRWTDIK